MATPIDLLAGKFSFIFPFLLVFAVIYALLGKTKALGDNKGVQGIVSFVVAIMFLASNIVRQTLSTMIPWIVLIVFFGVFVMMGYMMFGFGEKDIMKVFAADSQYSYVTWWVVTLFIIAGLGSLFYVLAQEGGVGKTGGSETVELNADGTPAEQESAFWDTLVHPKVLGMILILLIGMFTIQRLAKG